MNLVLPWRYRFCGVSLTLLTKRLASQPIRPRLRFGWYQLCDIPWPCRKCWPATRLQLPTWSLFYLDSVLAYQSGVQRCCTSMDMGDARMKSLLRYIQFVLPCLCSFVQHPSLLTFNLFVCLQSFPFLHWPLTSSILLWFLSLLPPGPISGFVLVIVHLDWTWSKPHHHNHERWLQGWGTQVREPFMIITTTTLSE